MKSYFKNSSILFIALVCICFSCDSQLDEGRITIKGRELLVDKSPYVIKGICYHPVPKGSNQRDFDNLTQDLELMVEAGINTIRVYAPIDDIEVLDEIYLSGLKIIIGFGYNQEGHFDILSGTFLDYVNKYKNHEAILMWELGNEFNYHPEWFDGDLSNWYEALNNAADLIHENDSLHPVTTAHGDIPDSMALKACPSIDVWGLNVYRWDNPSKVFSEWKNVSAKPMYLSEAGADSYMSEGDEKYRKGVNENSQADANRNILNAIFDATDVSLGVTMFSFTDGWWKAGDNKMQDVGGWAPNSSGVPYDGTPNEEYWGIVDIERNKKLTFEVLKTAYNEN